MEAFQQRVVDEEIELNKKTQALESFLLLPLFQTLDVDERMRMRRQLRAMRDYQTVLQERIAAFKRK